jgi:Ca2+-binding RTX toxin-like protein
MASVKGTNRGETLKGTALGDKIQALGGNDVIFGFDGNDTIDGGGGDDTIDGGAGSDTIDGGLGIDTIDYSNWTGRIFVNFAGYATDTNGVGKVEEYGSTGSLLSTDQFSGIENIICTRGNDQVYGLASANTFWGGDGDDRLNAGGGNDTIYGGLGDDLIDVGNGNDTVDGGDGCDTLFWDWGNLLGAVVDLQAGRITYDPSYGPDNWDLVLNFENVRGRDGNKQIYGTDGKNIVQGSTGSDLIDGRGGDDVLVGDYGRYIGGTNTSVYGFDDRINGGAGNDLVSGDIGNDVLTGGTGADLFVVDSYYGTDRITDFEDAIDKLVLFGGLTISGWETRDTNADGTADAAAALLSNGQAIWFDGYLNAPSTLAGGSGVVLHSQQFFIPELTDWSAGAGSPWTTTTAAEVYAAAATPEAQTFAALTVAGGNAGAPLEYF